MPPAAVLRDRHVLTGTIARLGYHTLRVLLVVVFLWSGVSKALAPRQFAETVGAYGLLPFGLVLPAALLMIVLEIVAALALLGEMRGGLTLTTLLMLLFVAVLCYGIYLGLDIDCGCFGPDDPEQLAFHNLREAVIRDLLLLLACGYLYCWRFINRLAPAPWLGSGLRPVTTKED